MFAGFRVVELWGLGTQSPLSPTVCPSSPGLLGSRSALASPPGVGPMTFCPKANPEPINPIKFRVYRYLLTLNPITLNPKTYKV